MGHLLGVDRPAAPRRAARRRAERKAPGREPSLRARARDRLPRQFPGRASVPHDADRLDGGPERRHARRRRRVVPHVLRRRECRARARRRHRRSHGPRESRTVLRPHPRRPGTDATRDVDRGTDRQPPRNHAGRGRAASLAAVLEYPARGQRRLGAPGTGRGDPRRRQDLATVRAAGLSRAPGRYRQRRPVGTGDRRPVQHLGRREARRPRRTRRSRRGRGSPSLHRPGPDARRTRARADRPALRLHPWPRAHRRLRRQGRRARGLRGLCGRSRLLRALVALDRASHACAVAGSRANAGWRKAITRSPCCRSRSIPQRPPLPSTGPRAHR